MRRGQIFLILTIMVITFLVGITGILLDSQKAAYLNPVPDSEIINQAWDNTYDSIKQILIIQLSKNSNGPSVNQNNIDLSTQLGNLENYLVERGISTTILTTQQINYTIVGDLTSSSTVSIEGGFSVHMQSGDIEINHDFVLHISYTATSSASDVIVYRTINNEKYFINNAELTSSTNPGATYTNYMNGRYGHTLNLGDDLIITAPQNIDIQLVI